MKRKAFSVILLLALIMSFFVSCGEPAAPPSFSYNDAPLPAYAPLIYAGPADGEAMHYSPEEMIRLHLADIPMTVITGGILSFETESADSGKYTNTFLGIYLQNGTKTAYTEAELSGLPDGHYILCAKVEVLQKDARNNSAYYLFAGVDKRRDLDTPSVYQRPTDTDLEFWITEDVASTDFSGYAQNFGRFGAKEYFGAGYTEKDKESISYLITAYPDLADGGKFVTGITVTDPDAVILDGLTAASSAEDWDNALSRLGLTKDPYDEYLDKSTIEKTCWATHDRAIVFTLSKKWDGGCYLNIQAAVTNKTGIVY